MKTRKPSDKEDETKLPFSFKKRDIPVNKIEDHWQKIADKIAAQNKAADEAQGDTANKPDGPATT